MSSVQPEKYASGIPSLAAEEAKHLRRARRLAPAARRAYLADLSTRLTAMADHVDRRRLSPVHAAQVARLRGLAETLRPRAGGDAAAGTELNVLWERTHAALVELADGARAPDRTWSRWYRRLLRFLLSW